MIVRKTLRVLALAGLLAFGGAACGDKTVTTPPTASAETTLVTDTDSGVSTVANVDTEKSTATASDATDDARLNEVDQMLRDIEADLGAADQDADTPEGDPTR